MRRKYTLFGGRNCSRGLFKYIHGQFTPLSKPFNTKGQAEKARLKLPERDRKSATTLGAISLLLA